MRRNARSLNSFSVALNDSKLRSFSALAVCRIASRSLPWWTEADLSKSRGATSSGYHVSCLIHGRLHGPQLNLHRLDNSSISCLSYGMATHAKRTHQTHHDLAQQHVL